MSDTDNAGLWHLSIFVNGCLGDYDAWHESRAMAIADAEEWGDRLYWEEPNAYWPRFLTAKGHYGRTSYQVEIIHYPTYTLCECADSQHDMLDFGHGIYDSTHSEECVECEEWAAHSESMWEAGQP
jgi:hypothetical protein